MSHWVWAAAGGVFGVLVYVAAIQLVRSRPVHPDWLGAAAATVVGALAGAGLSSLHDPRAAASFAVLAAVGGAAAVVDVHELRLPDVLIYPLGLAGLGAAAVPDGLGPDSSVLRALAGGAIYAIWMFVVAMAVHNGPGPGDVKLAAVLGLWLAGRSWEAFLGGVLAANLLMILVILASWVRGHRGSAAFVAMGPAMMAGALIGVVATSWS